MKVVKLLFSRLFVFGLILLLQVVWIFTIILRIGQYSNLVSGFLSILSILAALWIVYKDDNPAYKLAWIVPILLFPIFGGLLYLAMGNKKPAKRHIRAIKELNKNEQLQLKQDQTIMDEIRDENPLVAGQVNYISQVAGYPIHKNTSTKYYTVGETYYADLLKALRKAKHYIFMEYFILEEGEMWDGILAILEEKVKEGLDVRLMYDDVGSVAMLPYGYYKKVEKLGIKCIAFNPFVPFISMAMNNRDHRKITVIDGHTAFTGGINLADEYINKKVVYGHWKDTGLCLQGDAVRNFTIMFLKMWNLNRKTDSNYEQFYPQVYAHELENGMDFSSEKGYVQPYGDTPLDHEITGENVYLNIINQAKNYVYIFTPYLIIDHEMITALKLAAKRGVEVKIMTPGIPDKKTVYQVTRSYYPILMQDGVKIYEYSPGFLHAKCFVCDDEIATVGTINMDYRSLYLHFECGVYLYQTDTVMDVKQDMLDTLEKCREVGDEIAKRGHAFTIYRSLLRLFAPLM